MRDISLSLSLALNTRRDLDENADLDVAVEMSEMEKVSVRHAIFHVSTPLYGHTNTEWRPFSTVGLAVCFKWNGAPMALSSDGDIRHLMVCKQARLFARSTPLHFAGGSLTWRASTVSDHDLSMAC